MDGRTTIGRYPALDGLRGLSVIGVLANHLGLTSAPDSWWLYPFYWFSEAGWIGVDIFFVLSGFLITGILLANREAPNYFQAFYAHRSPRILPLYYLLLFIVFRIAPVVDHSLDFAGQSKAYLLFYSNSWLLRDLGLLSIYWIPVLAPTWSLAVEEQFYIVWSVAVRFLSVKRLILIAALLLPAGIALRCALLEWSMWNVPQYLSRIFMFGPTHLDGLCIGALLSFTLHLGWTGPAIRFAKLWWVFAAIVIAIFIADHRLAAGISSPYGPIMLRGGLTAVAIAAGSIVAHGLLIDGSVRKCFDGKVIGRVGTYSYCIYLFHMPIAAALIWLIPDLKSQIGALGLFALEISLTVGFAAASFRWFESKLLSLKRYLPYQRRIPKVPSCVI